MQRLPYRTNTTWLTDADLILLDVLFDGGATFCCLRHESFRRQWNVAYSHNLADTELRRRLEWLCEHCVLQTECHEGREFFHMSETGGELWSQERCPSWDRYCTERYKTTSRGRTLMSVAAVSPQIRDDFLRLWPPYPARSRTATIRDHGLIGWRRFAQLHVGLATYRDERQWTPEEYAVCVERSRDRMRPQLVAVCRRTAEVRSGPTGCTPSMNTPSAPTNSPTSLRTKYMVYVGWATAHQVNRQPTNVWYASTFPSSPTLNRQQSETLVQMLLEPPEPNAALQEAGEEYHRRVRRA